MTTAETSPLDAGPVAYDTPAGRVRPLRIWIGCIALLVVAMILVGGATRLTDSGLSITEWQPIFGVIPPLSDADWQEAFEAYKKIPEYTQVNRGMSLDAFKTIYWWEWGHRFLGRFIGLAFFVPFMCFWLAGSISRPLGVRLLGLFVLGGLQGALGWYMVKSGLVDRVDVSQYRLAAHFGVAILILGYALWLYLNLGAVQPNKTRSTAPVIVAGTVLALVYLQLLAGALVAGIDGGFGFNTWPRMNGAFIPSGLDAASPWYLNLFDNPLTVQFNHRVLGYAVVIATIAQAVWLAKARGAQPLVGSAATLAVFALLQATLGVWTLLLAVPLTLGLAHQAGAVFVFVAALYHFFLSADHESSHTAASP